MVQGDLPYLSHRLPIASPFGAGAAGGGLLLGRACVLSTGASCYSLSGSHFLSPAPASLAEAANEAAAVSVPASIGPRLPVLVGSRKGNFQHKDLVPERERGIAQQTSEAIKMSFL